MTHEILFTVERLGDMYAMNTPRGLLMARTHMRWPRQRWSADGA